MKEKYIKEVKKIKSYKVDSSGVLVDVVYYEYKEENT